MKRAWLGISLVASLVSPAHADNFASLNLSGFSFNVLQGDKDSFILQGTELQSFVRSSSTKNVNAGEFMALETGDLSYLTNPAYNYSDVITYDLAPWNGRYALNPEVSTDGGGYAQVINESIEKFSVSAVGANANNEFGGYASAFMAYYFRIDLKPNTIVTLNFDLKGQIKSNIDETWDSAQTSFGLGLNGYSIIDDVITDTDQDYSFFYTSDTTSDLLKDSEEQYINVNHSITLTADDNHTYFWGIMNMSAGASNPPTNSVIAVPEPETYGLFTLGFGVVGAMMRRRKIAT